MTIAVARLASPHIHDSSENVSSSVANVVPVLLELFAQQEAVERSALLPRIFEDYRTEFVSQNTPDYIQAKIIEEGLEEGFFVFDFNILETQYHKWTRLMPRVEPFYAVKCNPNPAIIRTLAALGTGFDCASKQEMQLVKEYLSDKNKIIFANPCKLPSHIRHAAEEGISMMTFDNADELRKIKNNFPNAKLVLRILPDDSHSLCKFGTKFGAAPSSWPELLQTASDLGLDVVGISFHVGSGCYDASAFKDALILAKNLFDMGPAYGFNFTLLDIGGGFPGCDDNAAVSFPEIAAIVTPTLDELFPPHVRVIGEPGRYFAGNTLTLVTTIHSRRVSVDEEGNKKVRYYIDDGVYGSFNCIFFDHQHPKPLPLYNSSIGAQTYLSNVFGPTCDSLDLVANEVQLPELAIGDWLRFEQMGAYTTAAASPFNGFKTTRTFFIKSRS